MWVPHKKHWRLNERHYGALQGFNKHETALTFGKLQTQLWRRSYDVPPPEIAYADVNRHPRYDRRYHDLPIECIPTTESLK
jgi:2,3-bisphosphoglycerate-dependent phosphoglycerate mutase